MLKSSVGERVKQFAIKEKFKPGLHSTEAMTWASGACCEDLRINLHHYKSATSTEILYTQSFTE